MRGAAISSLPCQGEGQPAKPAGWVQSIRASTRIDGPPPAAPDGAAVLPLPGGRTRRGAAIAASSFPPATEGHAR